MISRSLHSLSFQMNVYETRRRLVPKFGMKRPLVLDPYINLNTTVPNLFCTCAILRRMVIYEVP